MTHICLSKLTSIGSENGFWPVASFTNKVNPRLAKRPLVFNGRVANRRLTSLVKEATGRCQAIIWTNAGTLLTGDLGTNFSLILIEIDDQENVFEMSSVKWRPFCLGLNQLKYQFCMYGKSIESSAGPMLTEKLEISSKLLRLSTIIPHNYGTGDNIQNGRQDVIISCGILHVTCGSGLILGLPPANERCRYKVTQSLLGWA